MSHKAYGLHIHDKIVLGEQVCVIGCGEGRELSAIAKKTSEVTCIDIDQECIFNVSKKFPRIQFVCMDASKLTFSDQSFDVVTCMFSRLNFKDKKEASLAEMYRILRPGGRLYLSVFNEDSMECRFEMYKKVGLEVKEILNGKKVIFEEDFEANSSEQFTKNELHDYFNNAGFTETKIKKVGVGYV